MLKSFAPRSIRLIAIISLVLLVSASFYMGAFAAPQRPSASQIVVNTTADELNSNGNCSLREALQAANHDTSVDACPVGSGIDTITLPVGTYTLTLVGSNEDEGLTGDLDINTSLTIAGGGRMDTIIDGNQLDRVFHITGEYTFKISGVTIRNGKAAIDQPSEYGGGAILNSITGNLTLSRCILTANQAEGPGGSLDNAGTATLLDVTISGNSAENGGGVFNSSTIELSGVTFTGNAAVQYGGGFQNDKFATLTNVTISANTAPFGGGIYNDDELTLINTTLYANSTAIDNELGGTTVFKNTIVAGSTGDNCTNVGIIRSDFNIDSGASCNFIGANDLINTDPLLGGLQDNKGLTWTHELLEGSPAIDQGDNSIVLALTNAAPPSADGDGDESKICDIGAYEHNGAFPSFMYLPLTSR
jgi:CSLREA domain-containing protein